MLRYFLIAVVYLHVAQSNSDLRVNTSSLKLDDVRTFLITQKLDHFNESDVREWNMRYMVNTKHFKEGGPIFLIIGGFEEINENILLRGHIYDMAEANGAALIQTENRFFGPLRPTEDLATENLKYLSIKQALADLEHFIKMKKVEYANSTFIAFGKAVAGSMVVWLKDKYPEIISGGWAASAPLKAELIFPEYYKTLGYAIIALGNKTCYNRIEKSIAEIENMFATNETGKAKKLLRLCETFNENDQLDVDLLFFTLAESLSNFAFSEGSKNIPKTCDKILSSKDDLTGVLNYIHRHLSESDCYSISYAGRIAELKNMKDETGDRNEYYEACTELGFFPTLDSSDQPFGTTNFTNLFKNICSDLFGEKYTMEFMENNVMEFNRVYGGDKVNTHNIYLTRGEFEPCDGICLSSENRTDIILMDTRAHVFKSITTDDSPHLGDIKRKVASYVKGLCSKRP